MAGRLDTALSKSIGRAGSSDRDACRGSRPTTVDDGCRAD